MTLDERLAQAVRQVAEGVTEPHVDVGAIRSRAQAGARRRRATGAALTTVLVTLLVVTALALGDQGRQTEPAGVPPVTSSAPTQPGLPVLDTSAWATYTSERYDLTIGYPAGWTPEPAVRDWSWEVDAGGMVPDGMEGFMSPEADVFVTVFSAPLEPDQDGIEDLRVWVENYCREWTAPCARLDERAVELCVGEDCDPGLLVAFTNDVQAFFTGGPYDGRVVVASVWRNDTTNPTWKARYGSFTRLLEAFLVTMDVRPAPTPPTEPAQ